MSDSFVRWIPLDASFVPSEAARNGAVAWLRRRAPGADDVRGAVSAAIRFVDCGANLDAIFCPRCTKEIDRSWWVDAMGRAHETGFERRDIVAPCCGFGTRLDDLRYEWPVGFSRFVLEGRNPKIDVTAADDEAVAEILGTPVRHIFAHL